MRGSLVAILILIGGALTFAGALAAWEQRVLMNEGRFVATGNDVLEKDEVQAALAHRLGSQIEEETGVPGIAGDAVARQAVRGLPHSTAGDAALHGLYEVTRGVVRNEALTTEGDRIVIDLRPVAQDIRAAARIGGGTPIADELGLITIVNQDELTVAFKVVRWIDDNAWFIVAAPLVAFGLAFLLASNRFLSLAAIGGMIVLTSGARILLVKSALASRLVDAVVSDATYRAAADSAYDVIAGTFVRQDVILLVVGMALLFFGIAGAALWPRYDY